MDPKKDLYKFLEIKRNATPEEIISAYQKKCLIIHPDKNEDTQEEMKFLNSARDILLDPRSRRIYNLGGLDYALKGRLPPNFAETHLFETIFSRSDKESSRNIYTNIDCTLKDLYLDVPQKSRYPAYRICSACEPFYKESNLVSCSSCNRSGIVSSTEGSSNATDSYNMCPKCLGAGIVVNRECSECNGSAVIEREIEKTIYFDKLENDQIMLIQEGHHFPLKVPGNLYCFLEFLPDQRFTKSDNDIISYMEISLLEALTGVDRNFKHIDDRCYKVTVDGAINDGDYKVFPDLGFLIKGGRQKRGNLIIIFRVHYNMDVINNASVMNILKSYLPHPEQVSIPHNSTRVTFSSYHQVGH